MPTPNGKDEEGISSGIPARALVVLEGELTVFRRRNAGGRLGDRRANIWRTGRAWILLEDG